MVPSITIPAAQLIVGIIGLGLTIGGVLAVAIRRSARAQAAEVAREEVAKHADKCAWRTERDHLGAKLDYVVTQVDWIKAYLLNGKRIGP